MCSREKDEHKQAKALPSQGLQSNGTSRFQSNPLQCVIMKHKKWSEKAPWGVWECPPGQPHQAWPGWVGRHSIKENSRTKPPGSFSNMSMLSSCNGILSRSLSNTLTEGRAGLTSQGARSSDFKVFACSCTKRTLKIWSPPCKGYNF